MCFSKNTIFCFLLLKCKKTIFSKRQKNGISCTPPTLVGKLVKKRSAQWKKLFCWEFLFSQGNLRIAKNLLGISKINIFQKSLFFLKVIHSSEKQKLQKNWFFSSRGIRPFWSLWVLHYLDTQKHTFFGNPFLEPISFHLMRKNCFLLMIVTILFC